MIELWVVGRILDQFDTNCWDILGVYSSEEQAKAACVDEETFIAQAFLNQPLPAYPAPWPVAYYPLLETKGHIPLPEAVAKYGD